MEHLADLEVEKKFLSALMLDEGIAIPKASELIKPDDLYRPEHKMIYQALLELSDENKPVNVLLVMEKLNSQKKLTRDTRHYVLSVVEYEYTTARVPIYAEIIKRYSKYRRLREIGLALKDKSNNERGEPEEISAWLDKELRSLETDTPTNMESIVQICQRQVQIALSDEVETGLQTKFWYLDKRLGGLKKSDLIIIAARPAMGKTAFALNIAANVAREHQVLFFSLEMSKAQIGNRVLASTGMIDANKIQMGQLSADEKAELINGLELVSEKNLDVDDTSALTMYELKQRARKKLREDGLDLIVVDYLQLLRPSGDYKGNRVQEVSELSRELKGIARELDVPVIALSQLSRSVELRADKRPQLSDLRESGSIEQDADVVMFLYREEYYDADTEHANVAEINVAKNRNGKTLTFRMHYEPNYLLFSDITRAV